MKTFKLLLILILAWNLSGCSKDESIHQKELDYIIFGSFYGECIGENCVSIYKLQGTSLFVDTRKQYPNGMSRYEGTYEILPQELYDLVADLASEVPDELLNMEPGTIGCPDCADGGGKYIEINQDGKIKAWSIDNVLNNIPESLHEFMSTLEEKIELLL
ncbi:MAG: hypothetical protein HKN68_21100 [Saprospiraceae bacterium]|nr:hypothetical protein [Saprospiraceae bacterium]